MAMLAASIAGSLLSNDATLPLDSTTGKVAEDDNTQRQLGETALPAEEDPEQAEEEELEQAIRVTVYFALNGERIAQLRLRPDVTIQEVARTVAVAAERSRRAAFTCNPRLIFREATLADTDTLESAGVYDGAHIVADMYPAIVTASTDGTAKIWNALSGVCEKTLRGHTDGLHSACFGPDGRFVATASEDRTARLWLSVTGETWRTLSGHTDAVYSVSFSPDGKLVATASGDHTARIWGVKNGNCLHVLEGHTAPVFSASFSLDGRSALTASRDCTLKEWSIKTGVNERTSPKAQEPVYSTSFSPNGRSAVTAQGEWTAKILDVKSGDCEKELEGHEGIVVFACYAPGSCAILSPRGPTGPSGTEGASVHARATTLRPKSRVPSRPPQGT